MEGKALGRTLSGFENTECGCTGSDTGLRSVSIKIALSFHPALPLQNSFIFKLYTDAFDENSPETTKHISGVQCERCDQLTWTPKWNARGNAMPQRCTRIQCVQAVISDSFQQNQMFDYCSHWRGFLLQSRWLQWKWGSAAGLLLICRYTYSWWGDMFIGLSHGEKHSESLIRVNQ